MVAQGNYLFQNITVAMIDDLLDHDCCNYLCGLAIAHFAIIQTFRKPEKLAGKCMTAGR